MLTIADLLKAQHRDRPDAPALLAPARLPATYADLWEQARHCATILRALGLDRRARIGVCVPNGPEAAAATLTVAAAAYCAPLNPAYRDDEFGFYLQDLRADVLIILQGVQGPIRQAAVERGVPVIELAPRARGAGRLFDLRSAAAALRRAARSPIPSDRAAGLSPKTSR